MYLRLMTQWNCSQGSFIGLNYQSLDFMLNLYPSTDKLSLVEDIQIMERAALGILNKRGD